MLILIRGIPGSGKSHIAQALVDELTAALGKERIIMLDPDTIDYDSEDYNAHSRALAEQGVEAKLHPFRYSRQKAHDGITGHQLVVWNQPFSNMPIFARVVGEFQRFAAEQAIDLRILIVEVEIDHQVAKQRIVTRKQQGGHGPSDDRFQSYIDDYTGFKADGDGCHVLQVRGDDAVGTTTASIIKALHDISR
jgi:deoxyadenosine/deoxycytidine kinase